MKKTVLAFGETLWDLLPTGPVLGGAPFNFTCRINSLGHRGVIASRVGRDDYGDKALQQMASMGLETTHVQRDDQRSTGTVQVTVDSRGTPEFEIAPDVAYDYLEVTYELLELAGSADCFCFGTLAQRSPVARQTLQRLLDVAEKPVKFFDINLRKGGYTLEIIRQSLRRTDVLKLNQDEAHYLAGVFNQPLAYLPDFCAWLVKEWSLQACVVTLGEFGSYARTATGDQVHVPGFAVDVADTCGAGDAFSAAFMHGYLNGWTLADSCRLGNALGAMVSTRTGATYPFLVAEVQQFLTSGHRLVPEPTLRGLVAR